ncbi:MAG: hypothetical protein KA885_01315 [Spirochaetes bacterium]|nr:hypothetical protein [Spirochaetota bacterium]
MRYFRLIIFIILATIINNLIILIFKNNLVVPLILINIITISAFIFFFRYKKNYNNELELLKSKNDSKITQYIKNYTILEGFIRKNIEGDDFFSITENVAFENEDALVNYLENFKIKDKADLLQESIVKNINIENSYHKIPVINQLLEQSICKTETAAMELIEVFDNLQDDVKKSYISSKKNMEILSNGIGGKGFEEIITNSKNAINDYQDMVNNLITINDNNQSKFNNVNLWVDKIFNILLEINNISAKNKLISINTSIEAARFGGEGRGFQILAKEMRTLNEHIDKLTGEVNNNMKSFKKFIEEIIKDWNLKNNEIIDNIKNNKDNSDNINNLLNSSFDLINDTFKNSFLSIENIENKLNRAISSLQFQDITRQQIESVMKIITTIRDDISEYYNNLILSGIDIKISQNNNYIDKIKNEVLKTVKHFDEEQISNVMEGK